MKRYALYLILLCLFSCRKQHDVVLKSGNDISVNGFEIKTDTLQVNLKDTLVPVCKYNGNYLVSTYRLDSTKYIYPPVENKVTGLHIFDNEKILKTIPDYPTYEEFDKGTLDIIHDSIIVRPYYEDDGSYYLDWDKGKWAKVRPSDHLVFEDEEYYVTSLNFGEWGGATWFRDKKTGVEYAISMADPDVYKINGMYYLVTASGIYLLNDPKTLLNTGKGTYAKFKDQLKSVGVFYEWATENLYSQKLHLDTVYQCESCNIDYPEKENYQIKALFAYKNSIYVIAQDEKHSYIARPEKNRLVPVADLGDIFIYKHYQTFKGNNTTQNYTFYKEKNHLRGFMEIDGNKIQLHYVTNMKGVTVNTE